MSDFFGEPGWDGSLDETDLAPQAVAEPEPAVAEPEAVEEPVAEAPEEPAQADDRERDEQGRFLPKKIEVDDPDVTAYLAKYGGDPVKALKAATEAQRTLGSMSNELGELRPLREKLEAIEQRLDTPQQAPTQITQDLIDQNPAAATQLAYEQGNTVALQVAFEQWKLEDPVDAAIWVNEQRAQVRENALRAELAEVKAQYATVGATQETAAFAQVVNETVAKDPGVMERIQAGAANIPQETADALYYALETGSQAQKIGAFKALAELTRGPAEPATHDVQALAREQALAADEAIAAAAVVSAATQKSEPPRKMADEIGDEWAAIEQPLADGWNIS